jgi:hypothetical protein
MLALGTSSLSLLSLSPAPLFPYSMTDTSDVIAGMQLKCFHFIIINLIKLQDGELHRSSPTTSYSMAATGDVDAGMQLKYFYLIIIHLIKLQDGERWRWRMTVGIMMMFIVRVCLVKLNRL